MRKKKTNTLSRLACLLLTLSLLWLLPACGSGSASPFPPAEETVRAAAEKLDWTLLPEGTQVWAEDQILYTLKTNSQMDVALSCAVVKGNRTLTENCTAADLPGKPVYTWEDWKKAITLAETLYGGRAVPDPVRAGHTGAGGSRHGSTFRHRAGRHQLGGGASRGLCAGLVHGGRRYHGEQLCLHGRAGLAYDLQHLPLRV